MKEIPDTGSPLLNKPVRSFSATISGDPKMSRFLFALNTLQSEANRILQTANAGNVPVTDQSRKELEKAINGDLTVPQYKALFTTMKQDFGNRISSMDEEIASIHNRIGTKPGGVTPSAAPSAKRVKVDANGNVVP
jgi:hypothetical protein